MAGISRRTAYNYLKDEKFAAELNRRRKACISDTVRYMQGKLGRCAEILISIIESPDTPKQVKVNAINSLYMNCKYLTEDADIIDRLDRLEKAVSNEQV